MVYSKIIHEVLIQSGVLIGLPFAETGRQPTQNAKHVISVLNN